MGENNNLENSVISYHLQQEKLHDEKYLRSSKTFISPCNNRPEYFEHTFSEQISAKWGPDSKFVVKANTKSWWPKSSRSRIVKLMDQGQVTQPQVEYWVEYRILG